MNWCKVFWLKRRATWRGVLVRSWRAGYHVEGAIKAVIESLCERPRQRDASTDTCGTGRLGVTFCFDSLRSTWTEPLRRRYPWRCTPLTIRLRRRPVLAHLQLIRGPGWCIQEMAQNSRAARWLRDVCTSGAVRWPQPRRRPCASACTASACRMPQVYIPWHTQHTCAAVSGRLFSGS